MPENKTTPKLSLRKPKHWSSVQTPTNVINEEFQDAKTLLISSKRPKTFLIRTARELFAGGTEVLILSALGDAMPLGVHLQVALESSKAATVIRVETTYNLTTTYTKDGPYTPGLRIFMRKHPEFRGSRISPGYVSFCNSTNVPTPLYEENAFPNDKFCTLIKSTSFNLADVPEFANLFQSLEPNLYFETFTNLFNESLTAVNEEIKSVTTDKTPTNHPNVSFALCRASPDIGEVDSIHGACLIAVFKDTFPLNNENNAAFALTIPPDPKFYTTVADYLEALTQLGNNLMTTLCDYNGYAKRQKTKTLPRITVCRIPLFHPVPDLEVSKLDAAKAFLNGLALGYRHGPSPRLNFCYDDDSYKTAWIETTGLPVYEQQT